MDKRKLTTIVMIASMIILLGYDVWVYFQNEDATISIVFWLWSQHNPVTALIAGFLMGHWFAPPHHRSKIK
jgi:hypothetical protein